VTCAIVPDSSGPTRKLEERFVLVLVNTQHMQAVPGRRTNVKDAEWIAGLLRHGPLTASFVPERHQRELRELVRHRPAWCRSVRPRPIVCGRCSASSS
jgi:hypothetical protein